MRQKRRADLDVDVPRVLALAAHVRGQVLEVVVADDQVVGDAEDGGAERAVAVADQRAVGFVDLVALVTGRAQAGAAGDGLGVGVVFDGPHLAGEVGGADDVDAGEGEQQHVGRLHQAAGDVAFQGLNFLGFSLAIVVQGQGDAEVLAGGDVAGGGLFGPVEDGLRRCVAGSECRPGAASDIGLSLRRRGVARRWGSGGAGARGRGCPRACRSRRRSRARRLRGGRGSGS